MKPGEEGFKLAEKRFKAKVCRVCMQCPIEIMEQGGLKGWATEDNRMQVVSRACSETHCELHKDGHCTDPRHPFNMTLEQLVLEDL